VILPLMFACVAATARLSDAWIHSVAMGRKASFGVVTTVFERFAREDGQRLIFMVSSATIGSNVES
jgi:hypothetical protein